MPGVLLVSMTTSAGSIKISGANGAGRAGVTPKEDKHNYSEIDSQSGNGEVCKQVSQPDRYCKQPVSDLIAETPFIPKSVYWIVCSDGHFQVFSFFQSNINNNCYHWFFNTASKVLTGSYHLNAFFYQIFWKAWLSPHLT